LLEGPSSFFFFLKTDQILQTLCNTFITARIDSGNKKHHQKSSRFPVFGVRNSNDILSTASSRPAATAAVEN
jgi:hypothetical protein